MCHLSDFKTCFISLNVRLHASYWACATSHFSAATNVIIVSLPRLPLRYRVARTAFWKPPKAPIFVRVVALSWINASRIGAMRLKRNGKRAWVFSILFPVFIYLFIYFSFLWTRSISVVNTRATWCGLKLHDIMERSRATTVRSNKWR